MLLQAFTVVLCLLQLVFVGGSNLTDTCHSDGCSKGLLDAAVELIKKGRSLSKKCGEENGANCILDAAVDLIEKAKGRNVIKEKYFKAVDCEELLTMGFNKSGNYSVWPRSRISEEKPLDVYCDMETDGGGWTVIQRRGDFGRPKDYFHQGWKNYKEGFGNKNKDFWLGNDNIFSFTSQKLYSVRFDLKAVDGEKRYALYDTFWIEDETRNYTLHINNYSGNAGESMGLHNNTRFSTKDNDSKDNDAKKFTGGWWHFSNIYSNLNGLYLLGEKNSSNVIWYRFKRYESLKSTEIKIRAKLKEKN